MAQERMTSKSVNTMPDRPSSTSDNVISIRTGRPFHPASDAEPTVGDLEKFAHSVEPDDFKHRMLMNLLAFGFVALLVIAGVWLANSLAAMRKDQDCVLSGKRGCTPVESPVKTR